jgi:hypothetical protein
MAARADPAKHWRARRCGGVTRRAVACTRDDEQATHASTETPVDSLGPAAAQAETCNRFLDLQTAAPLWSGPHRGARRDGHFGKSQRRQNTRRHRCCIPRQLPNGRRRRFSQRAVDAHNDLVAHCRAIRVPGLNPAYHPRGRRSAARRLPRRVRRRADTRTNWRRPPHRRDCATRTRPRPGRGRGECRRWLRHDLALQPGPR